MRSLRFRKYQGAGNDFILVDNRDGIFTQCLPYRSVEALCHRSLGIGADGVILWENSQSADARIRIFNANGSEAEMCGNGARCFYRFLQDLGHTAPRISVETMERQILLEEADGDVAVSMGDPTDIRWNNMMRIPQAELVLHYLNTGVPHLVCFVDDLASVDVKSLGPLLRHHPAFAPKGANVNWVQLGEPLMIRTYERGVEGETLACGTGATAAALAAAALHGLPSPVTLQVASGEKLVVRFKPTWNSFTDVWLAGPANFVYEGVLPITEPITEPLKYQLSAPVACGSH